MVRGIVALLRWMLCGTSEGTINSDDDDVVQVAAALADACHAGGLSDGYYRNADDALRRLVSDRDDAIARAKRPCPGCGETYERKAVLDAAMAWCAERLSVRDDTDLMRACRDLREHEAAVVSQS
jgi:hypothetical protein